MAATTGAKALREAEKRAAAHRAHVRDFGYWSKVGVRVQLKQVSGLTKKGLLVPAYRFQMPPTDDWGVQASMGWTDYETIGGDTLSRPGAEGLRTISFSTLFLDYDIPGTVHKRGSRAHPTPPFTPMKAYDDLREIMESGTPFRLSVGNAGLWGRWDVQMLATLRSVDYTERAGEPDSRYIGVSFTEYLRPKLYRKGLPYHPVLPITVTLDRDGTARDTAGHRMGSTAHPVTLHILAREYYGASSKWRLIAHANHDWRNYSPSRHLNLAPKGRKMKLKIPKAPHAAHKDDDKDDKK
jgi:hypothetical protein